MDFGNERECEFFPRLAPRGRQSRKPDPGLGGRSSVPGRGGAFGYRSSREDGQAQVQAAP